MEAFERAVVCLLAISLWSGISAKDAPLPEENMNVVSFSRGVLFLLQMAAIMHMLTLCPFNLALN